MNLRPLLYLAITSVILAGLLAGLALFPTLLHEPTQPFLQYNDVNGMSVEHGNLLFTLNFEQQNDVIKFVNTAISIEKPVLSNSNTPLPYRKIVVYRFDAPNIEISPLGFENDNLVFTASVWNQNKPLMERSGGQLKKLLEQTYD